MGGKESKQKKEALELLADRVVDFHKLEPKEQTHKRFRIDLSVGGYAEDAPLPETEKPFMATLLERMNETRGKTLESSDEEDNLSTHSTSVVEEAPALPVKWKKGACLGHGAFGRVYLGLNETTGELLAVKQIELRVHNERHSQKDIQQILEEINVMKTLNHSNIVKYIGAECEGNVLNVFLEYVPGGSISSLLAKFGSFSEPVTSSYTRQILKGLEYLHRRHIIHRDIKSANVLVSSTGEIKLADFGTAKRIQSFLQELPSLRGTPYYMAPEVIQQVGYGKSADIWSVGCTTFEMVVGSPPFSDISEPVAVMYQIASSDEPPTIPSNREPSLDCLDFLDLCFRRDPHMRPKAKTLLTHRFITLVRPVQDKVQNEINSFIQNTPAKYQF